MDRTTNAPHAPRPGRRRGLLCLGLLLIALPGTGCGLLHGDDYDVCEEMCMKLANCDVLATGQWGEVRQTVCSIPSQHGICHWEVDDLNPGTYAGKGACILDKVLTLAQPFVYADGSFPRDISDQSLCTALDLVLKGEVRSEAPQSPMHWPVPSEDIYDQLVGFCQMELPPKS